MLTRLDTLALVLVRNDSAHTVRLRGWIAPNPLSCSAWRYA